MAPRRLFQEESWSSVHHSEASGEASTNELSYPDDSSNDGGSTNGANLPEVASPPRLQTVSSAQRALHPLRATADRVGRQVETFAENLDRLASRRIEAKVRAEGKDFRVALPFVQAYRTIARETVDDLASIHDPSKHRQESKQHKPKAYSPHSSSRTLRQSLSSAQRSDRGITTLADLQFWEEEEQTWDLVESILPFEFPTRKESDPVRISKAEPRLHAYSTEEEAWNAYLVSEDLGCERQAVVKWLERCADKSRQSIEEVIENHEADADRGSGLLTHSWLYTREAIKAHKTLRSWPKAFNPDDPGLEKSLRDSSKTKPLVTQLDPDAVTRQGRVLEEQDLAFEQATWLASWEMMRRGKSWEYIKSWFDDRSEQWRAVVMQGNLRLYRSEETASDSTSWFSRMLWRKTCALAAKDGGVNTYEKAVYGILSGYLPGAQQVSQRWNDQLFAHYNAYLLHAYEKYLKSNFSTRIPPGLNKDTLFNVSTFAGQRALSGNQVIEKLRLAETTQTEARKPFKMLQGSLIARTFADFAYLHGIKICQSANIAEKSKVLPKFASNVLEGSITADISMEDYDMLRLLTHIIFIYQDLDYDFGTGDRLTAIESIIVAYIDYLSRAGKRQLLPLYASRLSTRRAQSCLARQLPLVQEPGERMTMINLMTSYDINVPAVLLEQLRLIILDAVPSDNSQGLQYPALDILESQQEFSAQARPVRAAFLGDSISGEHLDLINAFGWYMLLQGHWQQTMAVGVVVYKHLLRTGGLAAARQMALQVPFSSISLNKTKALLGQAVDLSSDHDMDAYQAQPLSPVKASKGRRGHLRQLSEATIHQRSHTKELLIQQSRTFRDFESLFVALDTLEVWRDAADILESQPKNKSLRASFKMALGTVDDAMEPVLQDWLEHPKDDNEARELGQIRQACLPELIIAYNSVLNFSAHYINRDILKQSMDLAALVAEDGSKLAACILAAGRMPELLTSFTVVAKNMILADEQRGKDKKAKDGRNLGLWTVRKPTVTA